MVLSSADALAKIKDRPNHQAIADALRWQNRVRFHGMVVRDKLTSAYWPEFKAWCFSMIANDDLRKSFEALIRFPLPTNRLLGEVIDGWGKLFDAVNPQFEILAEEDVRDRTQDMLDELKEESFWMQRALPLLVESHNCLLVADMMPDTGKPYFYELPLDSVVDIALKADATAEYVLFNTTDGRIVAICDGYYRTLHKVNGEFTVESQRPHRLGVCPVRLLCDERVSGHKIAAASPIDEVLYFLDYLVFWWFATDLFKLKGAFPSTYEVESVIEEKGFSVSGFGRYDPGMPDNNCQPQIGTPGAPTPAKPVNILALGDHRIVPPTDDPKAPVGMVEPSVDSLTFQREDREKQYTELLQYLRGEGGESNLLTKSLNEKQVGATFNKQENVLLYLSRILSSARSWLCTTLAKLQNGDAVEKVIASFGSEFYSQTEGDLWADLKAARDAGSPQTILLEKVEALQRYRHRQQPQGAERSRIMLDLEPYPEQSIESLSAKIPMGLVSMEDVLVKMQFTQLIQKLERSLGADITQIGDALPYSERINRINEFLYSNVKKPDSAATSAAAGPDAGNSNSTASSRPAATSAAAGAA